MRARGYRSKRRIPVCQQVAPGIRGYSQCTCAKHCTAKNRTSVDHNASLARSVVNRFRPAVFRIACLSFCCANNPAR